MPVFNVKSPTGEILKVNAPEGASQQDAELFVQFSSQGILSKPRPPLEDTRNIFERAVGRGTDIVGLGYGSAKEGLGRVLGLEGLEQSGARSVEEAQKGLALTDPQKTTFKDVREAEGFLDTTGKLVEFGVGALGESLPQMGTTLAGSIAGGLTLGPIGAIAGGVGVNIPFFYGTNREAQKEAIKSGDKIELSEGAAFLASLPQSFADTLGDRLTFGLKTFGFGAKFKPTDSLLTKGVKGATAGVMAEVPTEFGQQVIERAQANKPLLNDEAIEEYIETMAAAGLVGGGIRATTDITRSALKKSDDISSELRGTRDQDSKELELEAETEQKNIDAINKNITLKDESAQIESSLSANINSQRATRDKAQEELDILEKQNDASISLEERDKLKDKINLAKTTVSQADAEIAKLEENILVQREVRKDPNFSNLPIEQQQEKLNLVRLETKFDNIKTPRDFLTLFDVNNEKNRKTVEADLDSKFDEITPTSAKNLNTIIEQLASKDSPILTSKKDSQTIKKKKAQLFDRFNKENNADFAKIQEIAQRPEEKVDTEKGKEVVAETDVKTKTPESILKNLQDFKIDKNPKVKMKGLKNSLINIVEGLENTTSKDKVDEYKININNTRTKEQLAEVKNNLEEETKSIVAKTGKETGEEVVAETGEETGEEVVAETGEETVAATPSFETRQFDSPINLVQSFLQSNDQAFNFYEEIALLLDLKQQKINSGSQESIDRALNNLERQKNASGYIKNLINREIEVDVSQLNDRISQLKRAIEIEISRINTSPESGWNATAENTKKFKEKLTNEFFNENPTNLKIMLGLIKRNRQESIAPTQVINPTTPEYVTSLLSIRFGTDITKAITIAKNPQEIGLTELSASAKGAVFDKKVYLFTDNIEIGNEIGVFLHEIGAHVGMRAFIGQDSYTNLVNSIRRFAAKNDGTIESRLANKALERVQKAQEISDANIEFDDELLAYFIEEAVDSGVEPNNTGFLNTPLGFRLRKILNKIRALVKRIFGVNIDPDAQELVDIAYGAAKLTVRDPTEALSKVDKDLLYSIASPEADAFTTEKLKFNTPDPRNFYEFLRDAKPEDLKDVSLEKMKQLKYYVYNFTGFLQLADQVSKMNFKGSDQLAGIIRKIEAIVNQRKKVIDDKRREVEDFSLYIEGVMKDPKNKPFIQEFENIVHESTLDEVDLRNNTDLKVIESNLYKRFEKLPPALQKLYVDLANKYESFADEYINSIQQQLDSVDESGSATTTQRRELELLRRKIKPYFPLLRHNGQYWLDHVVTNIMDDNNNLLLDEQGNPARLRIVESFESKGDQILARKALLKEASEKGSNIISVSKPYVRPRNAERQRPMSEDASVILDTLLTDNLQLDKAQKDKIMENYLDLFPANSLKKQFKKRKGRAGFRKDSARNFAQVGHQMATQLALLEQTKELREAYGALDAFESDFEPQTFETDESKKVDPEVNMIIESLRFRRNFLNNPVPQTYATFAGYGSYMFYILGNLSSAFVNLSQLGISYFHMVGRYGIADTHKAYMDAIKRYLQGGRDDNTKYEIPKGLAFLAGGKTTLGDKSFGANPNLSSEYRELYDAGLTRGAIRRTTGQELIDMQLGVRDGKTANLVRKAHKYNYALSWYFTNTERANREISFMAAYDLARKRGSKEIRAGDSEFSVKKGDKSKEAAINFAVDFVDEINGPAVAETGPAYFQDGVGKVIGTFKRFALSQIYLQYRLFRDAFRNVNLDPEEKTIAKKQILSIMIPAFTIAGVKGLPYYGAAEVLAEIIFSDPLFGDEDEPFEFNAFVNSILPDFVPSNGFLNLLVGADFASRTGFGNMLLPYDNPYEKEKLGPWYYPINLAGPAVGIFESAYDGLQRLYEGDIYGAVEKTTPSFIRNPLKAFRFQMEGVVNRKGVPIMQDVPLYSVAMQALGFAPSELSKRYRENEYAKRYERDILRRRSGLLTRLNAARLTNDLEGIAEANQDIREFNKSEFGKFLPITGDVKKRSYKGFIINTQTDRYGMTMNPSLRKPILDTLDLDDPRL